MSAPKIAGAEAGTDGTVSALATLNGTPETGWSHVEDPGEPSTGAPRWSVTELEGQILGALVAGRTVLEIGTGLGVSTRALAATATQVATLDIDPWVHETIWPDLPKNVIPILDVRAIDKVDVVFIDGDHSTEATAADIETGLQIARRMVVCHDANYRKVAAAFDEHWFVIPTHHGIGVRHVGA